MSVLDDAAVGSQVRRAAAAATLPPGTKRRLPQGYFAWKAAVEWGINGIIKLVDLVIE
jgi:hypothetical protein